jgi:hypothetical protein
LLVSEGDRSPFELRRLLFNHQAIRREILMTEADFFNNNAVEVDGI